MQDVYDLVFFAQIRYLLLDCRLLLHKPVCLGLHLWDVCSLKTWFVILAIFEQRWIIKGMVDGQQSLSKGGWNVISIRVGLHCILGMVFLNEERFICCACFAFWLLFKAYMYRAPVRGVKQQEMAILHYLLRPGTTWWAWSWQ